MSSVLRVYRGSIARTICGLKYPRSGEHALVDVHQGGGRFDMDELKRLSVQTPGAIVALMDVRPTLTGNVVTADVGVAIVLLAADGSRTHGYRDENALDLVELVTQTVGQFQTQTWGYTLGGIWRPDDIRVRNLYTPALDDLGAAMWALTFVQRVELVDVSDLDLAQFDVFSSRYRPPGSNVGDEVEGRVSGLYTLPE